MSLWDSFKKKIEKTTSGLDFWDQEENKRQRDFYAGVQPTPQPAPTPQGSSIRVQSAPTQSRVVVASPQPQPSVSVEPTKMRDLQLPDGRMLSTVPKTPQDLVNEGLNAGKSWEQISKDTGVDLQDVQNYSRSTRPNYGIARIEKPKQSNWNKFRDVLDANTEADKWRRQEGNDKRSPSEPEKNIILENPGNIVSNTVGAVPRMLNTAGNQIVEVGYTAQQQFATQEYSAATQAYIQAVKSKDQNAINETRERLNKASQRVSDINAMIDATKSNYGDSGGLFNAGTLYNKEDSEKGELKTAVRKIGAGTAEGIFDVASLGLTGVTGKQVAKQGLKQTLKESTKVIAKNAALNTAQGMASSIRQGGDLEDTLKSGAVSGVAGTVFDVGLATAGGYGSRLIKFGKDAPIPDTPVKVRISEDLKTAPNIDPELSKVNVNDIQFRSDTLGTDIDPKTVAQYVKDIQEGKPIDPLVVSRENGQILLQDGKHRMAALQALGKEELPVVYRKTPEPVASNLPTVQPSVDPAKIVEPARGGTKSIAEVLNNSSFLNRPEVTQSLDDRLVKQYNDMGVGITKETVQKLRQKWGDDIAQKILERNKDATNIDDWTGFLISQGRIMYGPPKVAIQPSKVIDTPKPVAPVVEPKGRLTQLFESAPDAKVATPQQAREFVGAVTQTATEGAQAIDTLLRGRGSSWEDFSRAIHEANRSGVDPSPEVQELYNKYIKPSMDNARKFTGIETGEQKWYLPQTRAGVEKSYQAGGTLVSQIDTQDFGFSKSRTNAIPIDQLDHSPDAFSRYFTQTSSVPYRKQLAVQDLIEKEATKGNTLSVEQASKAIDTQEEIITQVKKAVTTPGATKSGVENLNLVDQIGKVGEAKGKTRVELLDPKGQKLVLGKGEELVKDSSTIFKNMTMVDDAGNNTNVFDYSGMERYRDADGLAYRMHSDLFKQGSYDSQAVRTALEEEFSTSNLDADTIKTVVDSAMNRLRRIDPDQTVEQIMDAQRVEMAKAHKNIAREQFNDFLESHKFSDNTINKALNYHAQRMLLNDQYARSIAQRVTDGIVSTYYRGALGLNPLSAFQNITENKRAVALFGTQDASKAMWKAARDSDITTRYGVNETKFGDVLEEKLGAGKKETLMNKADRTFFMAMFQKTEAFKDATLLHGLEDKYIKQGLTGTELTKAVLDDFNKYGIKYGQFGSVGYNKTKTGRLMFQFMQFQLKDAQITLSEASKAIHGDRQAQKYVGRLMAANVPIYLAMSALAGSSWQYVTGLTNPVQGTPVSADAGMDEKIVSKLPGGPFIDGMKDLYLAFREEQRNSNEEGRDFETGNIINNSIKKDAALLVPGGNQIFNKTGGFIADMKRGYNEQSTGEDPRARFAAPDDPVNIARGLILGKYSTDQAREYFGTSGIAGDLPGRGGDRQFPVDQRFNDKIKQADGNKNEINRLIEGSREQQKAKSDFFKTNPNLEGVYKEMTKTTVNPETKKRESDVISPEKWSKVYGDSSLKLYNFLKQKALANNKEFGDSIDPVYILPSDEQVREVLNLRSRATGDDIEREEILRATTGWYPAFEKAEQEYYKSIKDTVGGGDSDFANSPRKQKYLDLEYPAQSDLVTKYYQVKNENADAGKNFYKANADALSKDFAEYRTKRLEWINAKREIEGFPPLSAEAFNNVTFGYEDDESKVAKELYYKTGSGSGYGYSSGGGSSGSYMRAGNFGQKRALNVPSVKIKVSKVKIQKRKRSANVKVQRNKK